MKHFNGILTLNVDVLNPLIIKKIKDTLNNQKYNLIDIQIIKNSQFKYSYDIKFNTISPISINILNNIIKLLNDNYFCYKTRKNIIWNCDYIDFEEGSVEYI
jgi:hypothetical protein